MQKVKRKYVRSTYVVRAYFLERLGSTYVYVVQQLTRLRSTYALPCRGNIRTDGAMHACAYVHTDTAHRDATGHADTMIYDSLPC